MKKENFSLLGALGVSKHEITINKTTVPVYGLRTKDAAQLLESFGKLPNSARGVIKLLAPGGEEKEYFTTDYGKLSGAAVGWLNELLALSLRVDVEDLEEVGTEHLPKLLEAIVEANKTFFTDASRLLTTLSERVPALQSIAAKLTGLPPSPPSNETAGQ